MGILEPGATSGGEGNKRMPLFDSFSTAQSYRLPKMNSVPTTDDLKYAIAEGQKRVGKVIELPFEHPHNHQLFIVKLVLSVGNKQPPSWTLQKGDGASAARLWNRNSEDCLMIQNKIKIDSQNSGPGEAAAEQSAATARPMSLQSSFDSPFGGNAPGVGGGQAEDAPAAPNFYQQANQQFVDAFNAPQQMAPDGGGNWMDNLPQAPAFNPNSSRTNMPAMKPGGAAPTMAPQMAAPQMAPAPQMVAAPQMTPAAPQYGAPSDADEYLAPEAQAEVEKESGTVLPPPIKLDVTLIDKTINILLDENSGLDSLATFIYFLFREHALHQRSKAPFSVVVFEVALRIGYENVALPQLALPAIIERVKTVTTEFDAITHLSGGEFVALLPGINAEGVPMFADALHQALTAEPLSAGNRNEGVLAAIGMATLPNTCEDPEVLIAAARQAKETAKSLPHPILMFPSSK
ncbi:MAG TPA: diguanylate cyclase [Drouetiella sp.]